MAIIKMTRYLSQHPRAKNQRSKLWIPGFDISWLRSFVLKPMAERCSGRNDWQFVLACFSTLREKLHPVANMHGEPGICWFWLGLVVGCRLDNTVLARLPYQSLLRWPEFQIFRSFLSNFNIVSSTPQAPGSYSIISVMVASVDLSCVPLFLSDLINSRVSQPSNYWIECSPHTSSLVVSARPPWDPRMIGSRFGSA